MGKGLLVIGDGNKRGRTLDYSFQAFVRHLDTLKKKSLEVHVISYQDVLAHNLPQISSRALTVSLFFPFSYWNKHIEVYKKDSRIYGDGKFGRDYKKFFKQIEKTLRKKYQNKKIAFVNPPQYSILERDKKAAKQLFQQHRIPTPKSFAPKNLSELQNLLSQGRSLYIKPRFGAMGKGITYVNQDSLTTNFSFRKGKIISRRYDYNWPFCEINGKNRNRFLKILLSKDFIWEEAIDPSKNKGKRFDFRVYCIYGKVPYFYVKSAPAATPVTNWSQGGRIEKKKNFSKYLTEAKLKKVRSLALKVAKELKLNYAGVDILFSKDFKNLYVLEANSFPGYEMGFPLMNYLAKRF